MEALPSQHGPTPVDISHRYCRRIAGLSAVTVELIVAMRNFEVAFDASHAAEISSTDDLDGLGFIRTVERLEEAMYALCSAARVEKMADVEARYPRWFTAVQSRNSRARGRARRAIAYASKRQE